MIYVENEFKLYMVKLGMEVLDKIDVPGFDFSTLDYINITKNRIIQEQ